MDFSISSLISWIKMVGRSRTPIKGKVSAPSAPTLKLLSANHFCDSPAMLHVERFIHAASDLDLEVLVLSVLRYRHLVPLGHLKPVQSRVTSIRISQLWSGQISGQIESARGGVKLVRSGLNKKQPRWCYFWRRSGLSVR